MKNNLKWRFAAFALALTVALGSTGALAGGEDCRDDADVPGGKIETWEDTGENTGEDTGKDAEEESGEGAGGETGGETAGQAPEELPFADEVAGKWYAAAAAEIYRNGWMDTIADGETGEPRFFGEKAVTRGETVDAIWRMVGRPESLLRVGYADVTAQNPYLSAIDWATEKRVATGFGDGRFGWADSLTREQLAVMLFRYANAKGMGFTGTMRLSLDTTDQSEISGWAYEGVCWLYLNNVMRGSDGLYRPRGQVTRAELATVLIRFSALLAEK